MPDFDQSLPIPSQPSDNTPPSAPSPSTKDDPAIELVRHKLNAIFEQDEPDVLSEEQEIQTAGVHSKHQKFIQDLLQSKKSQAEIQASWHDYYQKLPASQKHQVWNEFYAYSQEFGAPKTKPAKKSLKIVQPLSKKQDLLDQPAANTITNHAPVVTGNAPPPTSTELFLPSITTPVIGEVPQSAPTQKSQTAHSIADTKKELLNKINARSTSNAKHNLHSLLFGLGFGLIVVFIVMFGFFNERFIAPFITPSRTANSSPIIINPSDKVSADPKVIIPKINVEAPVVYTAKSTKEPDIQTALEDGVVYYPGTPKPGENGNVVIVGHSSNNIFNLGKYKFAFVLLSYLQTGDTIFLNYEGKRYIYKVYDKLIVKPSEVSVLGPTEKPATLTLITCDPPGTNTNRLVIRAEQISPSPAANVASSTTPIAYSELPTVPGNSPSLFQRLFGWL